ncbi:hypothetical protein BDW72DRAFT_164166 [Aspergillus terricola var. indicus]
MPSASLKITVQCLLYFSPLLPELSCERAPILSPKSLGPPCSGTYSPGKQLRVAHTPGWHWTGRRGAGGRICTHRQDVASLRLHRPWAGPWGEDQSLA